MLKRFSITVIILTCLMLYSHAVKHVLSGGQKLGILTSPLLSFVNFTSDIKATLLHFSKEEGPLKSDTDYDPIQLLEKDYFILSSQFKDYKDGWQISLSNLKNKDTLMLWYFNENNFIDNSLDLSRREIVHPLLLSDSSIVLKSQFSLTLFCIDKNGALKWKNDETQFHHSIEEDHNGNIWTCTQSGALVNQFNKWVVGYLDNSICLVNPYNGKIKYQKSVSEILKENQLINFVLGCRNGEADGGTEPLHLNDVEPVLADDDYAQKGDVFISLRNRSLVLHFRPKTNELIKCIFGPFLNQHDVDYLGNGVISVFNNNKAGIGPEPFGRSNKEDLNFIYEAKTSEIIGYDCKNDSFFQISQPLFLENKIFTIDQGLHQYLGNNEWMIENQNHGEVIISKGNNILFKDKINRHKNGDFEYPHWTRVYTDLEFLKQ